jgi:predicted dehydrogenase
MSLNIAIVGTRHGHINDLIARLREHENARLVAICEEDEAARAALSCNAALQKYAAPVPVFDSYEKLLDEVACDAIGIGDYYGIRGARAIEALQRGKHIISDKPLCTRLEELDEIERLVREKNLAVGCQLDIRDNGLLLRLRRLIQDGELGEVHAISFGGQHPLMYGTRAGWYFEEGKHGGTINDIGIHAIDYVPWLTGLRFKTINAARNWNAALPQVPHFKDAAQMMLTLENGCGVLGDVSYFSPDSFSYSLPLYWRTTIWGTRGVAEANYNENEIKLYQNGETAVRIVPPDESTPGGYLEAFLREVRGETVGLTLSTEEVLRASRVSLLVQQAADENRTNVEVV